MTELEKKFDKYLEESKQAFSSALNPFDCFKAGFESAQEQVKKSNDRHDVSGKLPVVCTIENEQGELDQGWQISIERAGEIITEQSKKLKALNDFIDEFKSNYR